MVLKHWIQHDAEEGINFRTDEKFQTDVSPQAIDIPYLHISWLRLVKINHVTKDETFIYLCEIYLTNQPEQRKVNHCSFLNCGQRDGLGLKDRFDGIGSWTFVYLTLLLEALKNVIRRRTCA
ncbi:hypothetical protein CHS0354_011282 [Potamilus streckersoni]|uniref:Uncharacterized protein n=1 Tax=Potamilus streckersoni TaxID=2493646 RepID=A0AAE0S8C0_9BIVA|nr:hypothetical protein CHS0354_011282 [Potamilus streckersoni]